MGGKDKVGKAQRKKNDEAEQATKGKIAAEAAAWDVGAEDKSKKYVKSTTKFTFFDSHSC